MALFFGSHSIVPRSIRAKSANGLESKIEQIQLEDGMEYKFINFYFDPVKSEHVGWYYVQLSELEQLQGAIDAKITE